MFAPVARAIDPKPISTYGANNAAPSQDWKLASAFDTGPATSLDQVVKQLSLAIDRLSPHRIPHDPVSIHRITHAQLESYVCGANCAIKAWYKPGEGIFLDDTLKPETNIFDRSILLHELVHYFQDSSGYYRDAAPCDRWLARELDAYEVQNRYLGMIGHPRRVAYAGTNCHSHATAEDGIIRRQVFNGTTRDVDLDD
ncbi:MAG: DUF6647 family protein [Betaproteobacteria bacterium]